MNETFGLSNNHSSQSSMLLDFPKKKLFDESKLDDERKRLKMIMKLKQMIKDT